MDRKRKLLPVIFIFLIVCSTSAYFILHSSLFRVKTIYIKSVPDVFTDTSMFDKKLNIFFFPEDQLKKEMARNTLIKSMSITKSYPNSLIIEIEEKQPAVVYINKENYYIDSDGAFLPRLDRFTRAEYPQLLCELTGISEGRVIENENVIIAIRQVSYLSQNGTVVISVRCIDEENYAIKTDKTEIIISSKQDQIKLSASLLFLFKQFRIEGKLPERVDMRFEKPVVIPQPG